MQVLELGWRPEIPEHLPEGYKSFVRQCWEEDREKVGVLLAAILLSCLNFQLCSQIAGAFQLRNDAPYASNQRMATR